MLKTRENCLLVKRPWSKARGEIYTSPAVATAGKHNRMAARSLAASGCLAGVLASRRSLASAANGQAGRRDLLAVATTPPGQLRHEYDAIVVGGGHNGLVAVRPQAVADVVGMSYPLTYSPCRALVDVPSGCHRRRTWRGRSAGYWF